MIDSHAKNSYSLANVRLIKLENLILYITLICYLVDIGNMKYVVALIGAAIMALIMLLKKEINANFWVEFKWILLSICSLGAITFVLQVFNGFDFYAVNEIIYFITPLFFVFFYLQVSRGEDIDHVLNVIFVIYIIHFFVSYASEWSISNIMSISFANSYSPYESGLAFICVAYMLYFFYRNKLLNVFIAWIFNFLSLKRFSFIFATIILALFILYKFFKDFFGLKKNTLSCKRIAWLIVLVFICFPLILQSILNDNFQHWFYNSFGIDIDSFMLSRFTRMEQVVYNPNRNNTGLGSTTTFLTSYYQGIYAGTVFDNFNLHNDIFRIFVECGLLGSVVFTICYFKATKFKLFSLILMTYLFLEMIVNHLLGAGTVGMWIVMYLILYRLNLSSNKYRNRERLSSCKKC